MRLHPIATPGWALVAGLSLTTLMLHQHHVDAFAVPTRRAGMTMVMGKIPNPFAGDSEPKSSAPKPFNPVVTPSDITELDELDPSSPEGLIARTKVALAADLGIQNGNLLADNFVCIGPFLDQPLNKVDYLAAGRFFDLRSTFPDLDYRAHDYRIDRANPFTVRVTARTVGTMRGELRLRNEVLPPNGQQMRCPPEAISLTFDPDSGKITKLCTGFTMDRQVGNTGGLCGVMAAATVAGSPPSDWEVYPALTVAQRFFGRPVEQIGESTSFLAPFPETVMVQLAKGILSSNMGASDPSLLSSKFTFMTPTKGPVAKKRFLEEFAEEEFAEVEPELSHFRVDPYDPNRVWVDVRPLAPGFEGPPQAMSFTFDDDGFCVRITSGYVMDPSLGNAGGLGGPEGYKYAMGEAAPGLATRPIPRAVGRLQKQILAPITGSGADDFTVSEPPLPFSRPSGEEQPSPVETLSSIKAERPVPPQPKPVVPETPKSKTQAPKISVPKVPTLSIPKPAVAKKPAPPKPTPKKPAATPKKQAPPKKSQSFAIPKIPTLSLSTPTAPKKAASSKAAPKKAAPSKAAPKKAAPKKKPAPSKVAAPTIKMPTLGLSAPSMPKSTDTAGARKAEAQKKAAAAKTRQQGEARKAQAKTDAMKAEAEAKRKAAADVMRQRQQELKAEQDKKQAELKAAQEKRQAEFRAEQERRQAEQRAEQEKLRAELQQRQEEARQASQQFQQQKAAEAAQAKKELAEKRIAEAEDQRLAQTEAKKAALEKSRIEAEEKRAAQAEARRQAEEARKAELEKQKREAAEKRAAQAQARQQQEQARKAELERKRQEAAAMKEEAERKRKEAQKQKAAAAAASAAQKAKPGATINLFGIEFGDTAPKASPAPKPAAKVAPSKPRPTINLFGGGAPAPSKTPKEKATEAAKKAKPGATITLFGLGGGGGSSGSDATKQRAAKAAEATAKKAAPGASISLFGLGGGAAETKRESKPTPKQAKGAAKAVKAAEKAKPGASISLFGLGGGAAKPKTESKPAPSSSQAKRAAAAAKAAEKAKPGATINLFGLELGVPAGAEPKSRPKAAAKPAAKKPAAKKATPAKPAAKKPAAKKPTPAKPAVKKPAAKATAPRGVPTLSGWRKNGDGSITGSIRGSPNFRSGERVTTSPISQGSVASGGVVRTASGSRYFLS